MAQTENSWSPPVSPPPLAQREKGRSLERRDTCPRGRSSEGGPGLLPKQARRGPFHIQAAPPPTPPVHSCWLLLSHSHLTPLPSLSNPFLGFRRPSRRAPTRRRGEKAAPPRPRAHHQVVPLDPSLPPPPIPLDNSLPPPFSLESFIC